MIPETARPRSEAGFALVFSVWVLAILMVIVTAFAWNEMNEVKIAQSSIDSISARYLAEGGIERGIAEIKASYSCDTPALRAWWSQNVGYGSTWAKLGSYTSDANYEYGNLATTKYYMPSQTTSCATDDIGYFQVAVEDESGKVNINSTAAGLATMIDYGSYGLSATNGTNIKNNQYYRSVWDIATATGIGYATAFPEKRFLGIYPNVPYWLGIQQDNSGAINVNSAYYDGSAKGPLNAILMSGGSYITAGQRNAIYSYRESNPLDDTSEFIAACGAAPANGAVRYDSAGYYRLIARGATIKKGGAEETGEAMIEAYIKATFDLDDAPVVVIAWSEWWEIY